MQDLGESLPNPPAELAYRPERWTLAERGPETGTLNLLLLSPVHRTGSTLLQRICNARKKTLIWGEHGAVLKRFASVFSDIAAFSLAGAAEREAYFGQGENPNLWIADMCPELDCVQQAVVDSARSLLNSLYGRYRSDHDILGFKEVQYGRAEAELLRGCYPNVTPVPSRAESVERVEKHAQGLVSLARRVDRQIQRRRPGLLRVRKA